MTSERVVITGLGSVTPLGLDTSTFWQNLIAGKSGVARITRFDPSDLETQFAAEVKGFNPAQYMDNKEARRMDRFTQFALVAALEAVQSGQLRMTDEDPFDVGAIICAGFGGAETIAEGFKTFYEFSEYAQYAPWVGGGEVFMRLAASQ